MTKLLIGKDKDFKKDILILQTLLEKNENFAFSRFSDGEIFMLQNKEIILAANGSKIGENIFPGHFFEDDRKHFTPGEDELYRQKLEDALIFKKDNYYKGLSCRCCIGEDSFKWQLNKIGPGDEHNLTWANLFINANYLYYIEYFLPIFQRKNIVLIVNKNADITKLHFNIIKDFRIGSHCLQNNYYLVDEIPQWIEKNKIKNTVFLIAAASLTNLIIHKAYSLFDNNTYIDIGSSLNPFMPGIGSRRDYMTQLQGIISSQYCNKYCIW